MSQDPAHFSSLIDSMFRAEQAMGGRITGADFLSAMKFGRGAALGWSDDFVSLYLPTLIQEMRSGGGGGAGGPGNALMSAFQAIVGGTMSNKAAEEFAQAAAKAGLPPAPVVRTEAISEDEEAQS